MMITYALMIIPTVYFIKNVAVIWGTVIIVVSGITGMLSLWYVLFNHSYNMRIVKP